MLSFSLPTSGSPICMFSFKMGRSWLQSLAAYCPSQFLTTICMQDLYCICNCLLESIAVQRTFSVIAGQSKINKTRKSPFYEEHGMDLGAAWYISKGDLYRWALNYCFSYGLVVIKLSVSVCHLSNVFFLMLWLLSPNENSLRMWLHVQNEVIYICQMRCISLQWPLTIYKGYFAGGDLKGCLESSGRFQYT